jgi:hypothetical protein
VAGTVPLEALCIMQLLVQTVCMRTKRYRDIIISAQEVTALAKVSVDYFTTKFAVNPRLGVLDALIAFTRFIVPFFGDQLMVKDVENVYAKGLSL